MKTKADPTGQGRNRKRALKPFRKRLAAAEKRVVDIISGMSSNARVVQINAQKTIYDWEETPQQIGDISAQVALEVQAELETLASTPPADWYGAETLIQPATAGTVEATNTINRDLAALVIAGFLVRGLKPQPLDPLGMISAPINRRRLDLNILEMYASVKALSDRLSSRLSSNIIKATTSKQTPRQLKREVRSSFERARGEIVRTVDTSVNAAYTDAVIATSETAAEELDVKPRVMHISALTSTTRPHHAARHRLVYTVDDQEAWWNEGANRINCKCSVLPALGKQ